MWTPNQRCVGRAVRHDDILTAQGLKNVSLSVRTTNKRTQRQGQEANEDLEMSCRTKRDFIAWAVLEELLVSTRIPSSNRQTKKIFKKMDRQTLDSEDIGIIKSEFVANTRFL